MSKKRIRKNIQNIEFGIEKDCMVDTNKNIIKINDKQYSIEKELIQLDDKHTSKFYYLTKLLEDRINRKYGLMEIIKYPSELKVKVCKQKFQSPKAVIDFWSSMGV